MSETIIGCLTIGQSPRPDMLEELADLVPKACRFIESGALDNLHASQLQQLARGHGEDFYVTRLKDGREVAVSVDMLESLLHSSLEQVQGNGAQLAILLCTGEFPKLKANIPVLRGSEIIKARVKSEYRGRKVAIVVPDAGQKDAFSQRWNDAGVEHCIYDFPLNAGAEQGSTLWSGLRNSNVDFIVLDCFGYTGEMAKRWRRETAKTVLLPRQVAGEHIASFIGTQ